MVPRLHLTFAFAALVACSGASGTGLFAPPEGSSPGDGGGTGKDGAIVGPGGDGGVGPDGRPDELDGGVAVDAHKQDSGTHDTPFACGTNDAGAAQACTGGTLCCADQSFDPFQLNPTKYTCVGSTSNCQATGDGIIRCHNGNECAGQYCCGDYDGTEYKSVACAPSCSRSDAGMDHIRFCDPGKSGSECNPGEICSQSTALPGFWRCSVQ